MCNDRGVATTVQELLGGAAYAELVKLQVNLIGTTLRHDPEPVLLAVLVLAALTLSCSPAALSPHMRMVVCICRAGSRGGQ